MSNNNLVKVPIVDKNGKNTSVHKKVDDRVGTSRIANITVKNSSASEQDLLDEVNNGLSLVRSQLDDIERQRNQINALAAPLNKEYQDLIDMKMELEVGKVTHESSLEEIQELNRLASRYHSAYKNEEKWVKAMNPRFETDSFDTDHSVPIVTMRFNYDEEIDDKLVEDIKTFSNKVADGREHVAFYIMTDDSSSTTLNIDVNDDTCFIARYSNSGGHHEFSGSDGIRDALTWITKNAPWTYPPELKERLYPSDDFY